MTCARGILFLSVALLPVMVGCEADVRPERPGSYAFALLDDAPYTDRDETPFEQVLKQINAEELAWAIGRHPLASVLRLRLPGALAILPAAAPPDGLHAGGQRMDRLPPFQYRKLSAP